MTQQQSIKRGLVLATAAILSVTASASQRDDEIDGALRDFRADTPGFMKRRPHKSIEGEGIPAPPSFGAGVSKSELINAQMDRLEQGNGTAFANAAPANFPFPSDEQDRAEDLVDQLRYRTLGEMDAANLTTARLSSQPWSGSYWPIAQGGIAWRYSDPAFPKGDDWKSISAYVLDARNTCSVDQLSPAEKYDLLVGDEAKTLTHAMLKQGHGYYASYGKVETWMGICHGWAPASYMTTRPEKSVKVVAQDGHTQIELYPSDIKALQSLLWANGSFANRFIGLRCEQKEPATDENGRITDRACYGENPGTWHLSVVNQIGGAKRSFVMDAQHDMEIWNQPVLGYRYTYFNPQTNDRSHTIAGAQVPMESYSKDKFKRYRSRDAKSVVGVAMDLTYVAESLPVITPLDNASSDVLVTVHYYYDLELADDGRIIGGEWYSNSHPGFLWTPVPGARAHSNTDLKLERDYPNLSWDGIAALPSPWSAAAPRASAQGQPLAKLVATLELLSRM